MSLLMPLKTAGVSSRLTASWETNFGDQTEDNQKGKRVVQQTLGTAGKARELGLRRYFKMEKDPGTGYKVKALSPAPTSDDYALIITLFNVGNIPSIPWHCNSTPQLCLSDHLFIQQPPSWPQCSRDPLSPATSALSSAPMLLQPPLPPPSTSQHTSHTPSKVTTAQAWLIKPSYWGRKQGIFP